MVPDFTWDYMSHGPACHMGLCPAVPSLGTMSHGPCFTWDYVPQSPPLPPPLGTMSHGPASHVGLCPTVPYVTWDYVPQSHFTWDYVPWSLNSLGTICPMVPGLKWDSVQGRSQDFLKGGAQPSLARQTISPACQMYCAHITGDLKCF